MTAPIRLRRSMLFIPGDKPRAIEKARTLDADALIFDLEDSVAPENKAIARDTISAALREGGFGARELLVRVGSPGDTAFVDALPVNGVVLPKVEAGATVRAAAKRCRHPIWCMIETPLGVLGAADIAAASRQLAGLIVGPNDLVKGLHARHVPARTPILTALSLIVLAARAHGLAAIDGVHFDLDDAAGFETECRQGVELGFDGKSLIHPNQIDPANHLFAPDAAEIAAARAMIAAWDQARAEGKGVARIDGRMVEQLHVDDAIRLLALADAIAARG